MIAESTMGEMLREELTETPATNLLLSPTLYQDLVDSHPATADITRQRLSDQTLSVLWCEAENIPNTMLPAEAVRGSLLAGQQAYDRAFGEIPKLYGRLSKMWI